MVLAEASAVIDFDRARRDSDERALVAEAKAGSEVAFEKLYRMHVGRVHGLCLRMTANRERAEDCTQEAFIQAWRALPRFEGRSGFGTWLHRIAVNAVLAQDVAVARKQASTRPSMTCSSSSRIPPPAKPAATWTSRRRSPHRRPGRVACWCSPGCMAIRTRKQRRCSVSRSGRARRSCIARDSLLGARLAPAEQPS